jgi:hypothetical protein
VASSERAGFTGFAARSRRALEAVSGSVSRCAVRPPSVSESVPRLERDGELWTFHYEGREIRLKDSKGLSYLAALLREPGRELHVGALLTGDGLSTGELGDAGKLIDARAKAEYRRRLDQIREGIEEAESRLDSEAASRARGEREALASELSRALGLGGRDRRASAASERARINVQRRIRDVMRRVGEHDPALGRYLEMHVKTGVFCCFRP